MSSTVGAGDCSAKANKEDWETGIASTAILAIGVSGFGPKTDPLVDQPASQQRCQHAPKCTNRDQSDENQDAKTNQKGVGVILYGFDVSAIGQGVSFAA